MKNEGTSLLKRLHAKIGDFWWYSLMIFLAARAADCLNVFVGLWLVPKYVPPSELGAVQPLANFANFFAIPAAVFATTFRQEISNLAVNREFGKMKSLMRGVFIATAAFFFLAIVTVRIFLPSFLWRIRVAEGSLAIVILAASFVGTVSTIYTNPLQALKKFKATSAIQILGAPIRLTVMLIAMPYRALVGYFVGQGSTPAFSIIASIIALRKELSVPAEKYWGRSVVNRFGKLFLIFGVSAVAGGVASLVEATIIRQRLPEIDSAAYYIITRFSEISSFVMSALAFTLFPFTAELAARGKSTNSLVLKASGAIVATNALLAAFFALFGRQIIALIPNGAEYATFFWAIPWLIGITSMGACINLYTTAEMSANRFGYMLFMIPLSLMYPAALFFVTGYGYFAPYLPKCIDDFFIAHNIRSLQTMLMWMTAFAAIRLVFCVVHAKMRRRPNVNMV